MNLTKSGSISLNIPSIDGSINTSSNEFNKKQREKLDRLINTPSTISGWALLGKIFIGLIVGSLMAVLLFVLFGAVGGLIGPSNPEVLGVGILKGPHELSWLINLFLGFLVSFLGNLLLITAYGVFFSHKYTNLGKTIGLLLLTNAILSFGMFSLFLIFQDKTIALVSLFVFYVCISLFLSFCQIEFVVNPNYSASSLMGSVIGLSVTLLVLGLLGASISTNVNDNDSQKLMLLTPLLSFPLMILGQGIWEIIYAKMYENGSNPFYLPSRAELDTQTLLDQQKEELENEKITVEI